MTTKVSSLPRRAPVPAPETPAGWALVELTSAILDSQIRSLGDRLAHYYGQSSGRLGILRSLALGGPQTVPQIARSRAVARQGVQRLADGLAEEGLTRYADNPHHQRSKLLELTSNGLQLTRQLLEMEAQLADMLAVGLREEDIRTALHVLESLDQQLKESARMVGSLSDVRSTRSSPTGALQGTLDSSPHPASRRDEKAHV